MRARFLPALIKAHWRLRRHGIGRTTAKAIVLKDARTLYIPIPKAANSSIRMALCPTLGIDPATVHDVQGSDGIQTIPLSDALAMIDPDWEIFTVVRDPWQRARSAWRDKLVHRNPPLKPLITMGLEKSDSFATFLMLSALWPRQALNDHFISQTDLLAPVLDRPGTTILHMETLAKDWPDLCDQIEARGGVRPDPLPHLNSRPKPSAKPTYSPMERRLLQRLYGRDFAPLGY